MIGTTVSHYKIIEKLGAGGMGEVFLAEDTKLDRKVALKFLPADLARDSGARERLLREAKAASQLHHPNIVTIHSIEDEAGRGFIVMEHVEGVPLSRFVETEQPAPEQLVAIFQHICRGLDHAHAAGIVHRDLKPDNILMEHSGRVRILDFGVARQSGTPRLTQTGSMIGTMAYVSPEQVQGEQATTASDVFSLGVLMYELLSGTKPFTGNHEAAILYAIVNENPKPLSLLNTRVSRQTEEVVSRCLAKRPADRFASAGEVAAALAGTAPKATQRSIAVLPFANLSTDPENEFFSDGLAEELINALSKIEDLRVAARTSAFSFKGKDAHVRDIGRQLDVETILEGSVRRSGNKVRVTAQLVKCEDGYHFWSERFDRDLDDVFQIQDEITRAIVDHLKIRLLGEAREAVARRPTINVDALTLYMKGRYFWNKRTETNLDRGVDYFQQALAIDPSYPMAHVGLADAQNLYGFYNLRLPKEAFPRAREAAQRALELDSGLAASHTSLAYVQFYHDWNWEIAEKSFLRAQALDPSYAFAYSFHGNLLLALGKHDEALEHWTHSLKLDPLASIQNLGHGWAYYHAGQFDLAVESIRGALEMDPTFMVAHMFIGRAYEHGGRLAEATSSFQRAVELSERMPSTLADLGRVYARSGERDRAVAVLDELEVTSTRRYVSPFDLSLLHMALGNEDRAFQLMDKAVEIRVPDLVMLNVDARMGVFRGDPRFEPWSKRVGLPE
jgi:serine/threonine protein kinase/tetratricopeptide (TPR) repeat protein